MGHGAIRGFPVLVDAAFTTPRPAYLRQKSQVAHPKACGGDVFSRLSARRGPVRLKSFVPDLSWPAAIDLGANSLLQPDASGG